MPEAQTAPVTQPVVVPAGAEMNTPDTAGPSDVDSRAAQLIEDIRAGKFGDEDGEDGADLVEEPAAAADVEKSEPVEAKTEPAEPVTDADKERREKLARATKFEEQARAKTAKIQDTERQVQDLFAKAQEADRRAQERLSAAEAKEKQMLDPAHLVQVIKKHLTGAQVAQLISDDLDPAKSAEMALERTVTPKLAEMQAKIDAYEKRDQEARRQAQAESTQQAFLSAVKTDAADKPYIMRLLSVRPQELATRADRMALRHIAEKGAADYNEVLSAVESELSDMATLLSLQTPGDGEAPSEVPADTSAAAPAPRARTLTNRNSAGRSTIVKDDDSLSGLEDRAAELKRLARKSG
jgi:hypothetical protein